MGAGREVDFLKPSRFVFQGTNLPGDKYQIAGDREMALAEAAPAPAPVRW